ncbi:MAG: hypothetical protein N3F65_00830 [Nitrososphaeria archaeon]|nr:hypothetical protein [Nitrososphaeria archaeon]
MGNVTLKFTAFLLLSLLAISMMSSIVSAEAGNSKMDPELRRLRTQAELLQRIIARAAEMSNMTAELKVRVRETLAANVSAMSREGLNDFVREAKAVLAELRRNMDSRGLVGEENVTRALSERLRERLEHAFMGLNVSKEERFEFKEKLRHAWSFGHLRGIMKDIRARMAPAEVHNITESILEFTNKSAEWGNMTGLERAFNSSSKVLEVLERVKEKLTFLNASPVAIAAIEHAMEKISAMRELLALAKERWGELRERHNLSRREIHELVKNRTQTGLRQVEERMAKCLEELEELREAAIEKNLTALGEELDKVLGKLRNALDMLREGNLSFKQAVIVLVEAERALKNAEKMFEKISEREEMRERLLEKLRERMRDLERQRDQLMERLRELKGQLPEDVFHDIEEMIQKILSEMQDASKDLDAGNGQKALKILERVEKTLNKVKDEIEELKSGTRDRGERPGQVPNRGGPAKRSP